MSGHTKKLLIKNEANAVLSLLFKSTGIDIPKNKKDLAIEKIIHTIENLIQDVQLEIWNHKS